MDLEFLPMRQCSLVNEDDFQHLMLSESVNALNLRYIFKVWYKLGCSQHFWDIVTDEIDYALSPYHWPTYEFVHLKCDRFNPLYCDYVVRYNNFEFVWCKLKYTSTGFSAFVPGGDKMNFYCVESQWYDENKNEL